MVYGIYCLVPLLFLGNALNKHSSLREGLGNSGCRLSVFTKKVIYFLQVTLVSGKVVRYEYLKEHSEISSRDEVPRCEQKAFDLLRKEKSNEETGIYLQDSDDEACSKDEDSAFPELQDVVSMHFSSFSITLKL